jgi:hypothetical protein
MQGMSLLATVLSRVCAAQRQRVAHDSCVQQKQQQLMNCICARVRACTQQQASTVLACNKGVQQQQLSKCVDSVHTCVPGCSLLPCLVWKLFPLCWLPVHLTLHACVLCCVPVCAHSVSQSYDVSVTATGRAAAASAAAIHQSWHCLQVLVCIHRTPAYETCCRQQMTYA